MSTRFNAKQICEMALEDIGVISIHERGATKEQLRRALCRLDLIVASLSAVTRCFWLIPDTIEVPLTAAKQTYDLLDTMGSEAPADQVQFPVAARLRDPYGNVSPLTIVTRETWNEIADPAASGSPERIYIDRLNKPGLSIHPVLGDETEGWVILLDVQTFGPSFTGTRQELADHQVRLPWQSYLINKLAAWLGNGPIRNLGVSAFRLRDSIAEQQLKDLLAFENRQHDTEPPIMQSNEDFDDPGSGSSWGIW